MKFDAIEKAWLDHAYDGFPRKVGTPTQRLIHSQEDYLQYVWAMSGRVNLYTSLFSEITKETERYYRMYFDIDNEDLPTAHYDMKNIRRWFISETGTCPTIYFSGKKGFAIYFYFKPRKFEEYQYTCRAIVDGIRESIDVTSIDETVVGDTSRISRIPFTRHMESRSHCVPLNYFPYTFEQILSRSKSYEGEPEIIIDIADGIDDWLKEYEEKGKAKKEAILEQIGEGKEFGWNLPRIMQLAPKLIGGRRCLIYRVIIPKMWNEGQSYHEILKFVKTFIRASGSTIPNIERLVQRHLEYTKHGKSVLWSQDAFFKNEPWAWRIFNDT